MMLAFQEQFNTGRLFTETQVLVLMGYARGEERHRVQSSEHKEKTDSVCRECGHQDSEICYSCSDLKKHGYSFETGT